MNLGAGPRSALLIPLWGALWGCQSGEPLDPSCIPDRPDPGELVVGWVTCSDMTMEGGEGDLGDIWLANHEVRATLRNPVSSLTRVGESGGTLIDFAPWEGRDQLHEVVPLVNGGWLDVDQITLTPAGVEISGVPSDATGARATVSWVLDAEGPWLRVTGADDLWIHGQGPLELLDDKLVSGSTLVGHDGSSVEDLGGAILARGAGGLYVAAPQEGYAVTGSVAVSGVAPGAEEIRLYRQQTLVGKIALEEEAFSTSVHPDIDSVEAYTQGYAASPSVPPGVDLNLPVGPGGWVDAQPEWGEIIPRPFAAHWLPDDPDQGASQWLIPPEGGLLPTGPHPGLLTFTVGPHTQVETHTVAPGDDQTVPLTVGFTPWFERGDWVLAGLGRPSDIDTSWRGTDREATEEAWMEGLDFVVHAAEAEVATASGELEDLPLLPQKNGSFTVAEGGYTILAWPWSSDARRGAHGAVWHAGLRGAELLAAAKGGPRSPRTALVDQAWLLEVDAPFSTDPWPDLIALQAPSSVQPPELLWADWFRWLDAGAAIPPGSATTWVQIPDADLASSTDIERAMIQGKVCAGTGPLLVLRVEGAGPGEVAPASAGWPEGYAAMTGEQVGTLDTVGLYADGHLLETWRLDKETPWFQETTLPEGIRWAILAGWAEDGSEWATTGPVWIDPP